MAFHGKYPVRTKICINDNILEQVTTFNYLGCDIGFDDDNDVKKKLHRFQMICGTIRRTLGKRVTPETQIKFYKTMAIPVLTYGCETWFPKLNTTTKSNQQK